MAEVPQAPPALCQSQVPWTQPAEIQSLQSSCLSSRRIQRRSTLNLLLGFLFLFGFVF